MGRPKTYIYHNGHGDYLSPLLSYGRGTHFSSCFFCQTIDMMFDSYPYSPSYPCIYIYIVNC